jgi:serine/threonine protein kinase/tetratricopeptide (TPR) repeat protein
MKIGTGGHAKDELAKSIFLDALEIASEPDRLAYLDRRCGPDHGLRAEVEALLCHQGQLGDYLERPALDQDATRDLAPRPIAEGPGTVIGPYKLMEQIGEGGMGVVYVAEQHQPVRRKVALKIIKPGMDTKQVVARFEAERQALAMMDHPNIARVFDGGATDSGRPYFVMELVRGIPITEYCDREKLTIAERLELFVLVCRAVQHAHQKGIIHRDLKPSNILVTVIDGAAVPKVIDFGVAKATGAALTDRTVYTAFQQFIGTPLYMSPEQADLAGVDVDTRSDIYSLGVLLYELLTGTTPFDQDTFRTAAFDEMRRILREQEPPRPSTRLSTLGAAATTVSANRKADARQLDRTIRGELDWVVMKALEKDRRRRYETAGDFASDVMRYLTDQPVQACPPSAGYRLRKFVRRNKGPVAASLALAALMVLGTVGTSVGMVWALRAEAKAKDEAAIARAVDDFLREDLLAQAGPDKQPDRDLKVRALLDRAAARIAGRFERQPLVEAAIRQTIGDTYRALGLPREARPHLERSRALRLHELGEDKPETLEVATDLAAALADDNQSDKAESILFRVIEVGRRALGEDHIQVLHAQSGLGWLYKDQGKLAQAQPLLVSSLDRLQRVAGERHPRTLAAMHNVAALYRDQDRLPEAGVLLERMLEIHRSDHGEEHPEALEAVYDLALIYWRQKKLKEAETLLVKVLEIRRRVEGREHPDTLGAMGNLGSLYCDLNHLDKAAALLVEYLEISRRFRGPQHPRTMEGMSKLAEVYSRQGHPEKAEPLLVEVLDFRRRTLGEEHNETLRGMENLARLYWSMGKWSQAEPLFLRFLEVWRRRHGEENLEMANGYNCMACLYKDQGKLTEAESLHIKALEIGRRVAGEEHNNTLGFMSNLAGLYQSENKLAEAESLYVRALEGGRRALAEDDNLLLVIMNNLATTYEKQGKYAQAEPLYVRALEGQRRVLGDDDPETLTVMANLGRLYGDMDGLDKGEPLLTQALERRRRVLGRDHADTLLTARNLGYLYLFSMRPERSIPLLEDLLKTTRDKLGPDHPDALETICDLGASYREAGRLPEATELLEQAWARDRKQGDPLAGKLASIPLELGLTYERAGRFGKAESLYREAVEMVRQQHEEPTSTLANLQAALARNLINHQKFAEAEPFLRECLKFREQKEPDDYVTLYTKSLLGASLLGQKKYAEAEPLLLAGYDGMKQRERKISPFRMFRMTEAIEWLVQFHEATGRADRADEWRRKLPAAKAAKPTEAKKR